jgi:hypothetical protein
VAVVRLGLDARAIQAKFAASFPIMSLAANDFAWSPRVSVSEGRNHQRLLSR